MAKMTMSRRDFLGTAGVCLTGLAWKGSSTLPAQSSALSGPMESLYKSFLDPDRKYSIRPFWFWNGKLTGEELSRQMQQMVENGVYGAYAHNRDGLQIRYLSDDWWNVLGEALQAAKSTGFSLCMVDEFQSPSGEARDYGLPGINKSRVLEAHPEFYLRRMRPVEKVVTGPQSTRLPVTAATVAVVAAKRIGPDRLEGNSLEALRFERDQKELSWDVPSGDWLVTTYELESTVRRCETVDLMSREAVAEFIKIYYEEFYRRHGQYFGNAMPATFADHEGDYGGKLPWTPRLFETFQRKAGYDLVPYLPALLYDIGPKTEKVRCDLLDTVSELYSDSFFKQVSDWCKEHNVEHTGHVWEESLFWGAAWQGDFFRILRSFTVPGCDTLLEWGRQSVWLKEVVSVAAFEGRHVVCENQGVQGGDSYLSPTKMRRVSNCLGAWDIGEFVPHAFNYDLERTNYPPDWFRGQPFLPWFRSYADQMRRISFVNRESQHIADLLVLYPQVSIWGQASTTFRSDEFNYLLENSNWTDDAVDTNQQYVDLKLRLTNARFDFMVADDHYIAQSTFEKRRWHIANCGFRVLILPPMSTTRLSTARQIRNFYQAGGTVIALRRLPYTSVEAGRNDAELKSISEEVFDTRPTQQPYRMRKGTSGGASYFVSGSVADLVEVVREIVEPDVEIVEGPPDNLYALHKKNAGIDLYWLVNDSAEPRTWLLRLRAKGRPEKWDAPTGQRSPVFYQTQEDKTTVRLSLGEWDAAYIVFEQAGPDQPLALAATNLDDFNLIHAEKSKVTVRGRGLLAGDPLFVELQDGHSRYRGEYRAERLAPLEIKGDWNVTVEGSRIPLPYALVREDPADRGRRERWYARTADKASWNSLWLSPLMRSIRQWNVIGPFPNPGDHGLENVYAPENDRTVDYKKIYEGDEGQELCWHEIDSAADSIRGGTGNIELADGPYGPSSYIVDYGRVIRVSPIGTIYLQTNVYVPQGGVVSLVLVAPHPTAVFVNNEKAYSRWLSPLYLPFTDGFATRIPIRLDAGWNSLLIKFLHSPDDSKPTQFTGRVEQTNGTPIDGVVCSSTVSDNPQLKYPGYRWLTFPVPAVASALHVPQMSSAWLAYVDGRVVSAAAEIPLPRGTRAATLRVSANEALDTPFAFSTASARMPLGTWKIPGLEHFSGIMVYEKTVDVPGSLRAQRVLLDCGEVGVCAEAWVNGKSAGSRPWPPYVFDVTECLHPGENQIKIRVANTEANARAVGVSLPILANIDVDGWHGPVRLVPFVEREIVCSLV